MIDEVEDLRVIVPSNSSSCSPVDCCYALVPIDHHVHCERSPGTCQSRVDASVWRDRRVTRSHVITSRVPTLDLLRHVRT